MRTAVWEHVSQFQALFLRERPIQAQELLTHLQELPYLLGRQTHLLGQFCLGRLPSQVLLQARPQARESREGIAQVHREPDGAPLVGDGAGDGLADPPEGMRAELESPRSVKFLDGAQQTQVALLNKVFQWQALSLIAFGNAHHQLQVGLDELLPDLRVACLDALGHVLFLLGGKPSPDADLTQVLAGAVSFQVNHDLLSFSDDGKAYTHSLRFGLHHAWRVSEAWFTHAITAPLRHPSTARFTAWMYPATSLWSACGA